MIIKIHEQTFRASQIRGLMMRLGEITCNEIAIIYEPSKKCGGELFRYKSSGVFWAKTMVKLNGELISVSALANSPFMALCDLLTKNCVKIDGVNVVK